MAVAVTALFTVGRSALAQTDTTSVEPASADELFYQGKNLMEQGRVSEACQKLSASLAIRRRGGTLLNLAVCRAAEGRYASALGLFQQALQLAEKDGRPDRQQLARAQIELARAKLSWLTVTPAPQAKVAAGFKVLCDGEQLPPTSWGAARAIDPGRHAISAVARGVKGFETTVVVGGPGDTAVVEIPPLAPENIIVVLAQPAAPALGLQQDAPPPPAVSVAPPRTRRRLAWATTGLGVVGIAVGLVFGDEALIDSNDSKRLCPDHVCMTPEGIQKHQDASHEATVATVAVGAGAVALGVGLYLLYTSKAAVPASGAGLERAAVRLVPVAQARLASLAVQGVW